MFIVPSVFGMSGLLTMTIMVAMWDRLISLRLSFVFLVPTRWSGWVLFVLTVVVSHR